ncbi:MAG TPA: M67 family metallopeptidase [Terracidiphilus sp.]|nr:M67 family metallopeptidase [Terracidiphilus sp.]
MSVLRLPRAVYEAIRAHGEETYPFECCGVLLGRSIDHGWEIEVSMKAGNSRSDSAHNRYGIAPVELVRIERQARDLGLEIAGFYHSHPGHPARWSATDLEEAHWIGCAYVITEIDHGRAIKTNSFLLAGTVEEDKRFETQDLEIFEP